jgi:hypothetical protein
MTAEDE